jgi:hypothetical protein
MPKSIGGREDRLRILVGVYLVRGPMGGLSWHYLQYAVGLAALGHDVYMIEDSDDHEWGCYDPVRDVVNADPTYGLAYADRVCRRLGLADRWAYHDVHGGGWRGPAAPGIEATIRGADLFLNISGAHVMRPWLMDVPARAFVDTDPAFRQIRTLTEPDEARLAREHTSFHTFGERFGEPDCRIPDDGLPWKATRQPVVLDAWPVTEPPAGAAFTTVMRWDSYAVREWGDLKLEMKSRSMEPYLDLPAKARAPLEIGFGGPGPEDDLRARGWRIRNPFEVSPDPWAFQDYISKSAGEFTVAKHGYVSTRSGWFSERSAGYLASGRAVITEDTGFSSLIPIGEGLISFSDPATALEGIETVLSDPQRHGRAARQLAEEYFDARKVLPRLLEDAHAS